MRVLVSEALCKECKHNPVCKFKSAYEEAEKDVIEFAQTRPDCFSVAVACDYFEKRAPNPRTYADEEKPLEPWWQD